MAWIPKLSIALRSSGLQYLIGLSVHYLYLLILFSSDTSYRNIQLPQGIYSENLWKGTDVLTYVGPAQNFLQYGIFGFGMTPDYRRTIGYPSFLSLLMVLFGTYWFIFAWLAQAALFALIYPLLSRISSLLFDSDNNSVIISFLFLILCGTYIVRIPALMTDTFFTVFFALGLWLGLESIRKKSYRYLLLHVICIGYTAQVRPVLALYPFINCLILIYISKKYELFRENKVRLFIASSLLLLLIICNMPSIRNYINHGFFQPTNILAVDLFEHLGRDVLIGEGKAHEYNILEGNVQRVANIKEKIRLQEELAMKIYSTYPARTLQVLIRNAVGIMGRAHWPFAARFWGYNFKDEFDPAHMKLKRLTVVFYLESFFNLVYFIVYLLFFGFLVRTFRVGNYMLFLVICLLIGYFLIPTFINPGGGSRMRLPVEGLIITMASCQFVSLFYAFKGKLLRLTRSAENLGPPA